MLISHKHRFIFVHIYKTAGSSIRAALVPFTYYNSFHRLALKLYEKAGIRPPLKLNPKPCSNDHSKVAKIIEVVGQKTFDEYFTFAIVRNPWDWQVSLYNYMLKTPTHRWHEFTKAFPDFAAYLHWRCTEEVRFQKDFICAPDGKILVDFVGRYEQIDDDFRLICERVGISANLPVTNVSKTRPYQEYYTPELIELVRLAFEPDIELFGYDFE
jgi:hypothetical protein